MPRLISLIINIQNKYTYLFLMMKTNAFIIYILNSCSVLYLIVYNLLHNNRNVVHVINYYCTRTHWMRFPSKNTNLVPRDGIRYVRSFRSSPVWSLLVSATIYKNVSHKNRRVKGQLNLHNTFCNISVNTFFLIFNFCLFNYNYCNCAKC